MASMTGQIKLMTQVFQRINLKWNTCSENLIQIRSYAARRSTRERKLKIAKALKAKKIAREEQQRLLGNAALLRRKAKNVQVPEYLQDKEYLKEPLPSDNVYINEPYQWKIYSLEEAVLCHREVCHPTMMDKPNSLLSLLLEFNLQGSKKTKTVNKFSRTVAIPNIFPHGDQRSVAAFCKMPEEIEIAKASGATAVFGPADIKEIMKGNISLEDFDIFVAHPSITVEMTAIKGFMKKKYPNTKDGTLSVDLKAMLDAQINGVNYTVSPYPHYLDYGHSKILIGQLNMEVSALKENCVAIIKNVYEKRPRREGSFVTRLRLTCADSPEQFKLDLSEFYKEEKEQRKGNTKHKPLQIEEEDDEDQENIAVIEHV